MKKAFASFALVLALCSFTALPEVGTEEKVAAVDGLEIAVKVQSPSTEETPLQIVCLFEYTEGDITTSPPALPQESNGMLHVDKALNGLITDLRKTNQFQGKFLETLLIIPPPNTLSAKKLMLIGLGNRDAFKPEMMTLVGLTGMREALRLNVDQYSHASDLKDAGYSSPTAAVTGFVIQGALKALRTQNYLKSQNASEAISVKKMTLLSGQSYFEDSKDGIKNAIEAFSKTSK